jgi:hypothetical protein
MVSCYICKSKKIKKYDRFFECERCGFISVDYDNLEEFQSKMPSMPSKKQLRKVHEWKEFIEGKDILDLGSGMGRFQKAMEIENIPFRHITNIDYNQDAIDHCRGLGFDALKYDVTDKLNTALDVRETIIAYHIVEHLQNPVKVVNDWVKLFSEYMIIEVPVMDEMRVSDWYSPEHLSYFTIDSFNRFLKQIKKTKIVKVEVDSNGTKSFQTVVGILTKV